MKQTNKHVILKKSRAGLKDVWNSFMLDNAQLTINDIPYCPTTATVAPKEIITWDVAKSIYKKKYPTNKYFSYDAFICWYMDDYKFDRCNGIWHDCTHVLKIVKHFAGIITPDFSTYQDFPEPIKIYNTYRMRAFGYWLGRNGINVINNVRWGSSESFRYCFDGIERNSIVAIGTVGGSPRKIEDRTRFENGLKHLITTLEPHTIIVYGSANYHCFDELSNKGISTLFFPSKTAQAFERRKYNV